MIKFFKRIFSNENTKNELQQLKNNNTELENKINSLNETIKKYESEINTLKDTLGNDYNLVTHIEKLQSITDEKTNYIYEQNNTINQNEIKINEQESQIKEQEKEIIELRDEILLQNFALYRPTYSFTNSEEYKKKLEEIRETQKTLIKLDLAATCNTRWTVNNSFKKGEKMVKNTKQLLLRAFNSECEYIVSKVKFNNYETCLKRMLKSADSIAKLGTLIEVTIEQDYLDLKIQELKLALEYQEMKQKEKEERREARARAKEDAKVLQELKEERAKAEKEKLHYEKAIKETKNLLETCNDESQHQAIIEKLQELQQRMIEINNNIANIDYRETNQRAGYVYIISNIGSFGKNIYKIGMTRRLDPMERIYELGNASVPFNFDVHAMIFSDDAPKLETALHKAFENKKINLINKRREFFNVTLSEIEKVVKENFDGSVEFIKNPDAQQYRETLKIKEQYSHVSTNS